MTVGRNVTTNSRMLTASVINTVSGGTSTLYTCPANCRSHASMLMTVCVNSNVTVSIIWNRANGDPIHILGGKNLSAAEFVLFTGAEMVMEPGETIEVTISGSTPKVDTMMTVEEFFLIPG